MSQMKKTIRMTIAGLSVATMSLISMGPGFAIAEVEDEETSLAVNPPLSSIPDRANLHVHKFEEPTEAGVRGDGAEAAEGFAPETKPLGGIDFTVKKVEGVNLKTNEGWKVANSLVEEWKKLTAKQKLEATSLSDGTGTFNLGNGVTKSTNVDGTAEFSDLETGLYVVTESVPATGVTSEGEAIDSSTVVRGLPFVVAVPLTNPRARNSDSAEGTERTEWLKTVHVYPKNGIVDIEKSVKDDVNVGTGNDGTHTPDGEGNEAATSKIVYTIKTDIPNVAKFEDESKDKLVEGTGLNNYQIIDPLDSRLEAVNPAASGDGAVLKVIDENGDDQNVALEKDTDYKVVVKTVEPAPADATNDDPKIGSYVTITFTDSGLKKLNKQGGNKIQWDLTVKVKDTEGKTDIPNQAHLIPDLPNNPADEWDPENPKPEVPGKPSEKVVSKYGKVNVLKYAKNGSDAENTATVGETPVKPLAGAKFELYRCDKDKKLITTDSLNNALPNGGRITVDNTSEWTTNDEGKFNIDGLQLNDFKNNKTEKEGQVKWADVDFYCLKETQAPEGYEGLPEMIQFQLLQNDTDYTKQVDIENIPANAGFNLPLTGGTGIVPIIALGGLLVLGAGGYAAVADKRNRKTS